MFPINEYVDKMAQAAKEHPEDKQAAAYHTCIEVVRGQEEIITELVNKCASGGMRREDFMPFLIEACIAYKCAYSEADYGKPFPYGVPEYIKNDPKDMFFLQEYRKIHDIDKKPPLPTVLNEIADMYLSF